MDKRDFLKLASAAIAAAVLPTITTAKNTNTPSESVVVAKANTQKSNWAEFDPAKEYGNCLEMTEKPSTPKDERFVCISLQMDMRHHIPPAYQDKTYVKGEYINNGKTFRLLWKYEPESAVKRLAGLPEHQ